MTNVPEEIHRVHPKWFLSQWYVQRKSCTYLASRLALSPNTPKRAFTWTSSPRSAIGCVQNDFRAMFSENRAPILHRHFHYPYMDWNEIPQDQCHIGDPSGASKMISEPMVCLAQTMHLSCVKFSTISKQTKTSIHLSLVTYEYHRVRPKRFLSDVWWKLCSYLVLTLTLSPNGLKRDSKLMRTSSTITRWQRRNKKGQVA
jgi:hypothetical protein